MSVVKNLRKQIGNISIEINEWKIADQGLTLLWGASGAGKTTVLRLLLGLEPADSRYEWQLGEDNLAVLPPHQKKIGVVFQHLALFPHLTARENILFPLQAAGQSIELAHWEDIVSLLGIASVLEQKTYKLSGGEKQRVALGRALVTRPRLLILDEPFSALDIQLKKQARVLLQKTMENYKIPVLLVSHDPQDVEALAQRVVILENGKIKAS
ncbi:MAG: ATP-binding cassette domain-containing protein, partial [Bdellovibrionales bacterium]|nr:ATP-binding cassette domain-containing protein [Bdellovibrionales bacterium]